ncbi:hypothetical protein D3C80_1975200 [compost metagenome]
MVSIATVAGREAVNKVISRPAAISSMVIAVCQRRSPVRSELRPQKIISTEAMP